MRNTAVGLDPGESLETVSCPLCDADDAKTILYGRDRLFGRPGRYRVVRCTACRLIYVNPRPTFEALAEHYPDDYFCYTPPGRVESPLQRVLDALGNGLSRRRLAALERVVGRLTPETRIADVGCGVNASLAHIRNVRGCEGIGVDFNAKCVGYVRDELKMPIAHGTLGDAKFPDGHFDVVTMHEYLEHEPNPRPVLTEARRVTRTGGHLALEVPHIAGLPAKVFRSRWSQLDLPRHLVFYTAQTLDEMLRRCGYRLVRVHTYGVPFMTGGSILHTLGFKHLGRMTPRDLLLIGAAGFPFLAMLPLLREFMHAVARAE